MNQIEQIQRNYLCAVCWGALTLQDGELICAKYGLEHYGYVSKAYVERRRLEDRMDYQTAVLYLSPFVMAQKTEEELLKELGF